jgi:hypothetical protein
MPEHNDSHLNPEIDALHRRNMDHKQWPQFQGEIAANSAWMQVLSQRRLVSAIDRATSAQEKTATAQEQTNTRIERLERIGIRVAVVGAVLAIVQAIASIVQVWIELRG